MSSCVGVGVATEAPVHSECALSGARMVEVQEDSKGAKCAALPRTGSKERAPGKKGAEDTEERLRALGELLADPAGRVSRMDQLSEATWHSRRGVAVLTRSRGRRADRLGHSEGAERLLWPEEALFLLECGKISLLLPVVDNASRRDEDGDDKVPMSVSEAYRRLLETGDCDKKEDRLRCGHLEYRVYSFLSRLGYQLVRHRGYRRKRNLSETELPSSSSAGGPRKRLRSPSPEVEVVPKEEEEEEVEPEVVEEPEELKEGPLGSLWKGKTRPLIEPREALSVAHILSRISLPKIDPASLSKKSTDGSMEEEDKLEISFDVFSPGVTLRRAAPRLPNYRVAVADGGGKSAAPTQGQINRACRKLDDKVPLLLAVVDHSSVAFYCLSEIQLPTEVTMG